jgi:hypothetical protein
MKADEKDNQRISEMLVNVGVYYSDKATLLLKIIKVFSLFFFLSWTYN